MTRTAARRLTVLAAAGGCLAAATLPALAVEVPVTLDTTGGDRQFSVLDAAGDPLTALAFGQNRAMPFRVEVADQGVPLLGNDFQVSATMSNLYLQNADGSTDHTAMVPSGSLLLSYGANPLGAAGLQLPVVPEFTLGGTLSCEGLSVPALSTLATVCGLIATLTSPVDAAVAGDPQVLDELDLIAALGGLDLAGLPLSLTGGQDRGRFSVPARAGADDPVTGAGATSKRLLTGTNLLTGDTLQDVLDRVDEVLRESLAGADVLPSDGDAPVLGTDKVLDALSQQSAELALIADLLRELPADQVLAILDGLTASLDALGLAQLSSLTGTYSSAPVLEAQPVTTRPGTYAGTMTVDFFQP